MTTLDPSKAIKVQSRLTQFSEPSACFVNVKRQVDRCGGKIVFGWFMGGLIFEKLPKVQTWLHHCVWETPEGELLDITPAVSSIHDSFIIASLTPTTIFIPDEKAQLIKLEDGRYWSLLPEYTAIVKTQAVYRGIDCLKAADICSREKNPSKEAYWCQRASEFLGGEIDPYGDVTNVPFSFDEDA